ncbi:MAG: hypothetical protein ACREMA_13115 [Longimicrobiales bacterium]
MKDDDLAAERREIQRCTEALTKAAGGVRPVGWTSPGNTGSRNTWNILRSEGYLWGADDASDDVPFLVDTTAGRLAILPRTHSHHNDLSTWVKFRSPPSIVSESFIDGFDQLYEEGEAGAPKWIELIMHCHMAGRPTLIKNIRKCIDHVLKHDSVWFARRREIAEWTFRHEDAETIASAAE